MTQEDAREIAKYTLPRLLKRLETSFPQLFCAVTQEERLDFFRESWEHMEQTLAKDVRWVAAGIEQKNHPTNRYV